MNRANEISTVKDGAREIALKKLREIREKNLGYAKSTKRKEQTDTARSVFRSSFRGLCEKLFCFKGEDFTKLTAEDFYEIHKDLKRRAKIYAKIQILLTILIPIYGWALYFIVYRDYSDGTPKYWHYNKTSKFLEKEYGPDWFQKIAQDLYD